MIRCAVVDLASDRVVNILDFDQVPAGEAPGYPGSRVIASDDALVGWLLDGGMLSPPPVLPAHVDAERERRIAVLLTAATGVEHTPDSARRTVDDGAREATRLLNAKIEFMAGLGPDWTQEQADRAAELKALDADVMAIEEAADALKAVEPIPSDYRDDGYWP